MDEFNFSQKREFGLVMNRRTKTLIMLIFTGAVLLAIAIVGGFMPESAYAADFSIKNQAPSWQHIFGTDYMGRDMLARTVKGLATSLLIGVVAATASAVMSVILGVAAATLGKKGDTVISMLINMMMGIPQIIMLMLISILMGKGIFGVIIAVAVTHWPPLARIIRAEVMQLRNSQYVLASSKFGKSKWWIARKHMLPHLTAQFIIGLVLMFPHAILHEAGITFLGFGLPLQMPAIGVILSESMKYLSTGMWWLAFFPGLALLFMVLLFEKLGDNLRLMFDPHDAHE